jgi:type II secretory pathway component GspD/PulD (secretin)
MKRAIMLMLAGALIALIPIWQAAAQGGLPSKPAEAAPGTKTDPGPANRPEGKPAEPAASSAAEKPAGEKPAEKPAEEKILQVDESEHGWTVHAVNADCHELLTTFAAKAHLPLIVDDTIVKRKLTIHLVDKPALEVLTVIVDAYGFCSAEVDGVHIVSEGMPSSPSSYLLSDIASVTTKYVSPAQAQQLLPVFLQGQVKLNTDQNAVVLSGPKPVLDKFRQDIEQFDIPAEQIMIDVNVVEFTDMDMDTFAALLGQSNSRLGITTDSLTGQLTLTAIADLPTLFFTQMQALVEKRKAHVRANPRVATVSGQAATVFIGQQQYLSIPVGGGGYGGGSNSIDAGVTLTVQPLTGGNGEIILDLTEEISTLSAPDPITGLPNKTTRSAKTTVRVRDGQTVVSGGLRQAESRSVKRAIPILSQIPLIGQFFRSRKTEKTNVDLAILITARSLSTTGHLPEAQEKAIRDKVQIGAASPVQAPQGTK